MHNGQRLHYRHHHFYRFVNTDTFFSLEESGQGLSFKVLHNDICSVVFFKAIKHFNYAFFVPEFCKSPGFINKSVQAVAELLSFVSAECGNKSLAGNSCCKFTGQILLDRHSHFQLAVPCNICNSESSAANRASY